MLANFTLENILSFEHATTFSMTQTRKTTRHPDHVVKTCGIGILKGAAVYGPNASGKSNLFTGLGALLTALSRNSCKSLAGMQFVMRDKINPFMRWNIVYTHEESLFSYSVKTDGKTVEEENLVVYDKDEPRVLFARSAGAMTEVPKDDPWFNTNVRADSFYLSKLFSDGLLDAGDHTPVRKTVQDAFKGLFNIEVLPTSATMRADVFGHQFGMQEFRDFLRNLMRKADLGITDVKWIPVQTSDSLDSSARGALGADFNERDGLYFFSLNGASVYYAALVHDREVTYHELRFIHGTRDMRVYSESDGTIKLLHYSLFLFSMEHSDKTWIVDEIDRSLHPDITAFIVEMALKTAHCHSQLIFTTHDVTLMTLRLWRSDEVWFVEKSPDNSSNLYCLYQFRPRHDAEIEKMYREGQWGARHRIES